MKKYEEMTKEELIEFLKIREAKLWDEMVYFEEELGVGDYASIRKSSEWYSVRCLLEDLSVVNDDRNR